MAKRIVLGATLGLASLFLAFCVLQSIMWAVWGAPVQVRQYVALVGCFCLFVSGIVWAFGGRRVWRMIAAGSLIAIGTVFVPASIILVPAHHIIVSRLVWVMIAVYFLTLWLVSLLPRRPSWGMALFLTACLTSLGFAAITYYQRVQDGEYVRPGFEFYRLTPGGAGLSVDPRLSDGLSSAVREELKNAGVTGSLTWSGGDLSGNGYGMIVICAAKPPAFQKLFYPRSGTVIYLFDGSVWKRIPTRVKTFSSYATLETVDNQSMLYQKLASGGIQGISAFLW